MMLRSVIIVLICMTLTDCGLKRPLELPGHDKHVNQNDAAPNANEPTPPVAPDSTSTTMPVTSSSNPASAK